MLSLSTIRHLRHDESLKPEAREASLIYRQSAGCLSAGWTLQRFHRSWAAAVRALSSRSGRFARERGEAILDAHRRVRKATHVAVGRLVVEPRLPVDVLGTYSLSACNRMNASAFTSIRTEGALFTPDFLQRLTTAGDGLGGLTPDSYLLAGEQVHEAATGWI